MIIIRLYRICTAGVHIGCFVLCPDDSGRLYTLIFTFVHILLLCCLHCLFFFFASILMSELTGQPLPKYIRQMLRPSDLQASTWRIHSDVWPISLLYFIGVKKCTIFTIFSPDCSKFFSQIWTLRTRWQSLQFSYWPFRKRRKQRTLEPIMPMQRWHRHNIIWLSITYVSTSRNGQAVLVNSNEN